MNKVFLLCFSIYGCLFLNAQEKSQYGQEGVETYATMRHGPDGSLFLDPYFLPYLMKLDGQVVLDAGCGAGPWSVVAAKEGALVYGIDIQENMIQKAKLAASQVSLEKPIHFSVGDVEQLSFPNDYFDRALSINVGCNLSSLELHIKELKRVLKKGGLVIMTAPASFETLFSDGQEEISEMKRKIEMLNQHHFVEALGKLDPIFRGTFVFKQGHWMLMTNEMKLESGEKILRKIPGMTVWNFYHNEDEYISFFEKEGFSIKEIYHPHFADEKQWQAYNSESQQKSLSKEYITNHPFVIFILEKP